MAKKSETPRLVRRVITETWELPPGFSDADLGDLGAPDAEDLGKLDGRPDDDEGDESDDDEPEVEIEEVEEPPKHFSTHRQTRRG